MRTRDFYGAFVSAAVTFGTFGFPLVAFLVGSVVPKMEVAETPDRWVSYEHTFTVEDLAQMMEVPEEDTPEPADESSTESVKEVTEKVEAPTPSTPPAQPEPMMTRDDAPAPVEDTVTEVPSVEPVTETTEPEVQPPGVSSKPVKKGPCTDVENPGINPIDGNHFTVPRTLVEYYTGSMARFNSLGWSKPYRGDDDKGWVIGGFGCRSPLHLGGLRRNDVIQRVNGKKTNTMVQVLGVYLGQRKKADFTLEILRNGKALTLHYTLV
jgi:hypothetical protein